MAKTRSWKQLVQKADPNKDKKQYEYEFSNGRKFLEKKDQSYDPNIVPDN